MSIKVEYRAGERKRKRESRWQASEAQREKGRRRSRARDKKQRRHFFVGRRTGKFCSGGDKMRNASGHQCLWPSGALINGVPGYSTVLSSDDGMIYLSFPTHKTKEVDNGAKIITKWRYLRSK